MGLKAKDTAIDASGWIVCPTTGIVAGSTLSSALTGKVTPVTLTDGCAGVDDVDRRPADRVCRYVGEQDRGRSRAQAVLRADSVDAEEVGLAVGCGDGQRAVGLSRNRRREVTGTVMLPPFARATGSASAVPILNGATAVTELIVTARDAVIVTVPVAVEPTSALPRSVFVAPTAEVVGAPKPTTCPSRVPTYTRPLSVATVENLAAVPSGALNTSLRLPVVSGSAR